jgi:hypothetical protein
MQDQGNRGVGPIQDQPEIDPYDELENVFDEPIVLEDPDLRDLAIEDEPEPQPESRRPAQRSEQPSRPDEGSTDLWARFMALEAEVRSGSERTLEALRRLGERMGSELAMLDKRAINLELTLARLRSIIESTQPGARKPTDATPEADSPADS